MIGKLRCNSTSVVVDAWGIFGHCVHMQNEICEIKLGDQIGMHVHVGHYSNLRSAFSDDTGTYRVKYIGKGVCNGKPWHIFASGAVKFACSTYTSRCKAFAVID